MDDPRTDTALLLAVADGERSAFDKVVRRYQGRLVRFAARSVGMADACDVVQEALVKAFVHADRYDPKWSAATWLFTLTRNAMIDRLRGKQREQSMQTTLRATEATAASSDVATEQRDLHGRLWQIAASRLNSDQTQALWLHYVEDLDTREVAAVMDRSWVWVKTALHRGRKALAPHVRHLHEPDAATPRLNEVIV